MATEEQVRANRENAQKSTGPRTPEGKARSSLNALTHGLTSEDSLVFGEDREEFVAFCAAWMAELAPVGVKEEALADRIAGSAWKLKRVGRAERRYTWLYFIDHHSKRINLDELDAYHRLVVSDNMTADILGKERFFANLDRHEAHIEREFYRAMDRLDKFQAERTEERPRRTGGRRKGADDGGQTADGGSGKANAEGRRPADAEREEKMAATASDSAKRSQSGAETPAAQEQAEFLRAKAAEEAASVGSGISAKPDGACGNGSAKTGVQGGATTGKAEEGDSAKRSQFGAAAPAGGEAESAPRLAEIGAS